MKVLGVGGPKIDIGSDLCSGEVLASGIRCNEQHQSQTTAGRLPAIKYTSKEQSQIVGPRRQWNQKTAVGFQGCKEQVLRDCNAHKRREKPLKKKKEREKKNCHSSNEDFFSKPSDTSG